MHKAADWLQRLHCWQAHMWASNSMAAHCQTVISCKLLWALHVASRQEHDSEGSHGNCRYHLCPCL